MEGASLSLYTIGHGARTTAELVSALRSVGVSAVVDVRRYPGSKRHPHFGRFRIELALRDLGVGYDWRGEDLGGRRGTRSERSRHLALRVEAFAAFADHMDTASFRAAFERLLADARRTPVALMCAETLWWRCHRRLISDALVMRGADVTHIIEPGKTQTHPLHDAARRGGDGFPVYDQPPRSRSRSRR